MKSKGYSKAEIRRRRAKIKKSVAPSLMILPKKNKHTRTICTQNKIPCQVSYKLRVRMSLDI